MQTKSVNSDSGIKLFFYNSDSEISEIPNTEIVDFLFNHLEQYGDPKHHIKASIHYALSKDEGKGGFVLTSRVNNKIVGAVVVNETGMKGFIPENILVYIAVDASQRGKGIGKSLMKEALSKAHGAVALHVEPDNPARKLYENLGFTHKYLEMRYQPEDLK